MSTSAKLAYKPLGLIGGIVAGSLAGSLVSKIWQAVDGEDSPPGARQKGYAWPKLLLGAALQGAVYSMVKTAIDRAGAQGFERATGDWPGDD